MKEGILILGLFVFVLLGCSPYEDNLLLGHWKIDSIEGVTDKDFENMRSVGFEFNSNGRYTFQSTLNKMEAGTYELKGKLLSTKDTTIDSPSLKSVQITKLSQDSLYFIMNNNGKQQTLKFAKAK